MAQPLELRVTVRRGSARAGESTEAEVSLSLKLGKADADLASLVVAKYHEVQAALVRAMESEAPRPTGETKGTTAKVKEASPPAAGPEAGEPPLVVVVDPPQTIGEPVIEGEPKDTEASGNAALVSEDKPVEETQTQQGSANADPEKLPEAAADRLLLTPAQKRTIRSLCADLKIDDQQFRAMLEGGYNRRRIEDLGRREAGGLIFRLSQKQRERLLRDKTEQPARHLSNIDKEEVFSQNGVRH